MIIIFNNDNKLEREGYVAGRHVRLGMNVWYMVKKVRTIFPTESYY